MKFFPLPILLTGLLALSLSGVAHADEANAFEAAFPEKDEISIKQVGGAMIEMGVGGSAFDTSRQMAGAIDRQLAFYDYSDRKEAINWLMKDKKNNKDLLHEIAHRDELLLTIANGHATSTDHLELEDVEEQIRHSKAEAAELEAKIKSNAKSSRKLATVLDKADMPRMQAYGNHAALKSVEGKLLRAAQVASLGVMAEAMGRVYLMSKGRDPGYSPAITLSRSLVKGVVPKAPAEGNVGALTTMTAE